ncbi:MAG: hypothetical protein ABSF51_04075 [Verrucomicrobiota bacterium]
MAIPKPNGSGLFGKYDIALFSNHLAELRPQRGRAREKIPERARKQKNKKTEKSGQQSMSIPKSAMPCPIF